MPLQTPKLPDIKLPKLTYSDFLWAMISVVVVFYIYMSFSEWQRNRLFKVTQDRLTLAYETHVYNEIRQANGLIHDRTRDQSTVDAEAEPRESLRAEDDPSTESVGYVPYRVGGARSLANVDENTEGVDDE